MTGSDFLSSDECNAVFERVLRMAAGGGEVDLQIMSRWIGSVTWARNQISVASDLRTTTLRIRRVIRGSASEVSTVRLDDDGLREAIRMAEESTRFEIEKPEQDNDTEVDEPILQPKLFSNETYRASAEARTNLVRELIAPTERAGFSSAGAFTCMAGGNATFRSTGTRRYYPTTAVECSITARDHAGTASGWAGVNHYDITKIDPQAIAARALDKAQHSLKPQAVEPGRYTVILEPQATAELFAQILGMALDRQGAEGGISPFSGRRMGWTRISEQVLDKRLTFSADPMDPDGGFIPYERYQGIPYRPVNWVDRGILRELSYTKRYALQSLGTEQALLDSQSFRLAAAPGVETTPIEQMIAKTERGILITRFHGLELVDFPSLLSRGFTRDGVWLIEHGKVSHPAKNFRFTESPLFAFNKVLDIGPAVRVFKPEFAWVAPAVRVDDFSLTGLADAV